jgi:hypothetical protein
VLKYGVVRKAGKKMHGKFCDKVLRMPRCAANQLAKLELENDGRRGNMLHRTRRYWMCLLHMEGQHITRLGYE